jgi:hypothetical protein
MTFQSLKQNTHPQIWIQEMKIVDYLMIGSTNRIGREMLCLPCAGIFSVKSIRGKIGVHKIFEKPELR